MSNTDPTQSTLVEVVESDDQLLDFTQRKRKELVQHLTKNGPPSDPKDAGILLGALSDMDKQVIGKKRLKIDEEAVRGGAAIAFNVAQVLRSINTKSVSTEPQASRPAPELGLEIADPDLIPGETDIAPIQVDYNTFQARLQESESKI